MSRKKVFRLIFLMCFFSLAYFKKEKDTEPIKLLPHQIKGI